MTEFALGFVEVECDECRTRHPAAARCPTCGRVDPTPDHHVERRRALVEGAQIRAVRADPDAPPRTHELQDLATWLEDFLTACKAVAEDAPEAVARLTSALTDRTMLAASLAAVVPRRPSIALHRRQSRIVDCFANVEQAYLSALTAPTPQIAESMGIDGQRALDRAADRSQEVARVAELWMSDAGSDEHSMLIAEAQASFANSGAVDIIEFDRRGRQLAENLLGIESPVAGLGLMLQTLETPVDAFMDSERFWSCARLVLELLVANRDAFGALVRDSAWRGDFKTATIEVRLVGIEASFGGPDWAPVDTSVRQALEGAGKLVERVAHHLLATLLTVKSRRPYARVSSSDVHTLKQQAADASLDELLLGIYIAFRDAVAHRPPTLVGDDVVFRNNRDEFARLSIANGEFEDSVISTWESCLAIHAGISVALHQLALVDAELADALAFDQRTKVAFALATSGWRSVSVTVDGPELIAGGEAGETRQQLAVLAAAAAGVDESIDRLTLRLTRGSSTVTVSSPTAPIREWSRADPDSMEKDAAFVAMCAAAEIDGTPIVERDQIRFLSATRFLGATDDLQMAIAIGRAYRQVATDLGDDDLHDALTHSMGAIRSINPSLRETSALVVLQEWATASIAQFRSEW